MMMTAPTRFALAAGTCVLALAVLSAPASAAPLVVGTSNTNNVYTNPSQTIALGETVQFSNDPALVPGAGGQHNVAWDLGDFPTKPSDDLSTGPWTISRTFARPGLYRFFCTFHGGPGGFEMAGRIRVRNADGSLPAAPAIAHLTATPGRGAVTLRFRASKGGVVTGKLARRQGRGFRGFGSVRLALRGGRNSLRITKTSAGRKLTAGAYRLALTFSDGVSNLVTLKAVQFNIGR